MEVVERDGVREVLDLLGEPVGELDPVAETAAQVGLELSIERPEGFVVVPQYWRLRRSPAYGVRQGPLEAAVFCQLL